MCSVLKIGLGAIVVYIRLVYDNFVERYFN